MDLAKYRALFLEEAGEHLAELSRGLLALEKDPRCAESLESVFRMAHSIKGMAASIGYDGIAELAHRLEDAIDTARAAGGVSDPQGVALLFRGLESLEAMVAQVREATEPSPPDPSLLEALAASAATPNPSEPSKKAPR